MESSFLIELNTTTENGIIPIQIALLNGEDMWGQGFPRCPLQLHIYQVPAICKMPGHNSTAFFLLFLML